MKKLVIVESPTKARTISKFLGDDYIIKASMGHLMDLPKSTLGVDVEHNFTPNFELVGDKKKIIDDLKSAAKTADEIILATDPDREGEAIASHVAEMLSAGPKGKKGGTFKRLVFHEITKEAIEEALAHPREVNKNLVDAQTARRVLDRLVGYKLSPLLWKKIRRGLSAGRVQSVALRLLVERERERDKFKKEPYYTITVVLKGIKEIKGEEGTPFELIEIDENKIEVAEKFDLYDGEYTTSKTTITTEAKAKDVISDLSKAVFTITDVTEKETHRTPQYPLTTSTLQQEASRRFGYTGKRTMSLAQKLYEEGYITYHRTDSVNMGSAAVSSMRDYVEKEYGKKYLSDGPRVYKTKQKLAQEAHEAIRPTKVSVSQESVTNDLGRDYGKLYDLIWRRTVATQMADAIIESTTVNAIAKTEKKYGFRANGSVLAFDGFLKINPQALQDVRLPQFTSGEKLHMVSAGDVAHETTPPPRYNDASLIKTLEEKGIGRPSSYASIMSTIVERNYVEREAGRFIPTSIGIAVNDFLVSHFSTIDDIPFTADMEDQLDDIAHGKKEWEPMMKAFYDPFAKQLVSVKDVDRVQIEVEQTNEKCEKCQSPMVIRIGKYGKFLSCGTFPACDFSKPFVERTNYLCPKDGGDVIVKKTRKGRKFFGCGNYPKCDFAAWKVEDILKAGGKVVDEKKEVVVKVEVPEESSTKDQ
jgi:DNA topoisomerase-1